MGKGKEIPSFSKIRKIIPIESYLYHNSSSSKMSCKYSHQVEQEMIRVNANLFRYTLLGSYKPPTEFGS